MGDQMFKDLDLSDDLTQGFHEENPEAESLSVKILQRSFWPFVARQKEDIRLPLFVSILFLFAIEVFLLLKSPDARRTLELCDFLQEKAREP